MNDNECYRVGMENEIMEDLGHITYDLEDVSRYGRIIDLANLFVKLGEVAEKIQNYVAEYHDDSLSELIEEKIAEIKDELKGNSRLERVCEELEDEFNDNYM